jgi:hypothetical protein
MKIIALKENNHSASHDGALPLIFSFEWWVEIGTFK